jgi:hypothetical protein
MRRISARAYGKLSKSAELEPIEVALDAEDAPRDHAHPLEDAVTVQEAVIGHRDLGLPLFHDPSVDPGLHGVCSPCLRVAPRACSRCCAPLRAGLVSARSVRRA